MTNSLRNQNTIYSYQAYLTVFLTGILRKLSVPQLGLYKVLKHHANKDITYEKELNATDKLNIVYIMFVLTTKRIVTNKLNNIETKKVLV